MCGLMRLSSEEEGTLWREQQPFPGPHEMFVEKRGERIPPESSVERLQSPVPLLLLPVRSAISCVTLIHPFHHRDRS